MNENVLCCLWCCRLLHKIPPRAAVSHPGAEDDKPALTQHFSGVFSLRLLSLPDTWPALSGIFQFPQLFPERCGLIMSVWQEELEPPPPEGTLAWIIQQLVWKMIVFGSVIDLPPEERRIYSFGAAAAERVQFETRWCRLKMNKNRRIWKLRRTVVQGRWCEERQRWLKFVWISRAGV